MKSLSEQVLGNMNNVKSNKTSIKNESNVYKRGKNYPIIELDKDTEIEIGDEIVKIVGFYFAHSDFIVRFTVDGKKHERGWKDFKQAMINSGYKI